MLPETADIARAPAGPAAPHQASDAGDLERLRRENAWLKAERARYRAVSDLAPGFAFDLRRTESATLAVQWVNPALQRLLEFGADQAGADVCRFLFAEDDAKAQEYLKALLAGQRVDGEIRVLTPSRGVRHLRFWARPVGDEARQQVTRVYGAAEDVTAQRFAEMEQEHAAERLRSLMEGLPGTLSCVSQDLRYIEVNKKLAALFGRRPDEFVDKPINFLSAGNDLHDRLRAFFESDRQQDAWELTPVVDGHARYIMVVAHKYADGTAAHLVGLDLTEQRRVELASREKDALYRALVETAPEAILVYDLDAGRIRDANVNAGRLLGREASDLVGKPLDLMSPPWQPDGRVSADRLSMLLQRSYNEPVTEEWTCRAADGLDLVCELRLNRLSTAPRLIRCSLRDLSEQKYREQELVAAREQAEAMMQIRASFLANMSHEFRTPLTGIIGFSALLSERADDEAQEMVQVIQRSGTRLLRMLNGILDLATLEAGTMEVRAAELNVGQEVREAVRLHEAAAAAKGLNVGVDAPDAPLHAILDPTLFQRVLASLLDNAIKFTEEGGATVRVSHGPGELRVAVTDTGIGISQSFQPFVFEGFSQESSGIARTHEGSGLGLAITKHIVELMDGTITVESERGAGTTFTVTFPLVESERAFDRKPEPPAASFNDRAVEDPIASILAVEDSADAQRMLHYSLGARYRLETVATEADALARAEQTRFDLVLMDVNLGAKRNGVDVLHSLREMPAYADTPIIAVTAYAMPGDRERFLRCGFDGYIGKPYTTAKVQEVVRATLASRTK